MHKFFAKKNTAHTSYWMNPMVISFIKSASETTRIPQGTILEIIITDYRLRRKAAQCKQRGEDLDEVDIAARNAVDYFLRIMPF